MGEDEKWSSVCEDGTDFNGDVVTEKFFGIQQISCYMLGQNWTPVTMVQPPNLAILYDMIWGEREWGPEILYWKGRQNCDVLLWKFTNREAF